MYRQKYQREGCAFPAAPTGCKKLKRQPDTDADLLAALHQYSRFPWMTQSKCHQSQASTIYQFNQKSPWTKQERACSTHTYPSEGSPDSKNVPLPPWLPCCRQTSNRWWCSVLQGWWRITRGSELPTARRNSLFAAFSSQQCLRGWARLGTASSALSRSAWLPRAPGSLTSWGALREEVPEKKQKPGCLALAVPWACSRPDRSHTAWTSRTEQAREPGSAFVFH